MYCDPRENPYWPPRLPADVKLTLLLIETFGPEGVRTPLSGTAGPIFHRRGRRPPRDAAALLFGLSASRRKY